METDSPSEGCCERIRPEADSITMAKNTAPHILKFQFNCDTCDYETLIRYKS